MNKHLVSVLWLYSTWSVADVGHGATFGGDVAHIHLFGLDLDLRTAAGSTNQCLAEGCGLCRNQGICSHSMTWTRTKTRRDAAGKSCLGSTLMSLGDVAYRRAACADVIMRNTFMPE